MSLASSDPKGQEVSRDGCVAQRETIEGPGRPSSAAMLPARALRLLSPAGRPPRAGGLGTVCCRAWQPGHPDPFRGSARLSPNAPPYLGLFPLPTSCSSIPHKGVCSRGASLPPSPLPPTGSPRLGQCDSWAGPSYWASGSSQAPTPSPTPEDEPGPGIWAEPSSLCCLSPLEWGPNVARAEAGSWLSWGRAWSAPTKPCPLPGTVRQASCQLPGPGHVEARRGQRRRQEGFVLHPHGSPSLSPAPATQRAVAEQGTPAGFLL